jgi:hypothetical protein
MEASGVVTGKGGKRLKLRMTISLKMSFSITKGPYSRCKMDGSISGGIQRGL